ncbi:MAG: DNA polymerase domain-containing protein [Nanoarchaeota archaeon]
MKLEFLPIDYDYFDFQGRNYVKIIGRDKSGKRVCVIDSCDVFFWAILKENLNQKQIKKLQEKIEKIQVDSKGRETKVEKVELHDKKFLGNSVKALKIFATNYKDMHDIADELGMPEIEKRRGYDIGFVSHYIIEKNFLPLTWYEIEGEVLNNSLEFGGIDSSLDVDFCIKLKTLKELEKKEFSPKVLAFDIETDDLKIGGGEILMISLVSENFKKVITWKGKENHANLSFVENVKDEAELLEKFVETVKKISPDFLTGYFSDGFDLPYLKARAEKFKVKLDLGLDGSQPKFSRGIMTTGKINGIVHIDLLRFIQTAYSQYMQSETMSLNEVANELLGDSKKDFEFKHSSKIKGNEWEKYFEYNLQDSVLTFNLFNKIWPDLSEFTKIMQEPVFNISRNGMSANVEDYIIHNLKKFNEIPEKHPTYDEIGERKTREKYEGAFVFTPSPGIYEEIGIFDFTSYWPSIIVTFNLSKSTILEKKEKDSLEVEFNKKKFYFSKTPGFFPQMLKDIIEKRKKYKKELAEKFDPIKKARSNAFKLLANASYGYQGFFGARYHCAEASAATTAISREFIQNIINKIDKEGYKTIYSDSVDGKTKVIIKKDNEIQEENIENLFKHIDSKNELNKEYNFKKGLKVLTVDDKGKSTFKPVEYVMRHKCNKKMFRVHFTNNWYVDVTEDHSLIGYQSFKFNQSKDKKENILKRLIEIKPEEIKSKVNTIISLKKISYENVKNRNYPKEIYEFMGYFVGDGSFMKNKSNKDYYLRLSLGNDKEEVFNKLIIPLKKLGYIKNHWWSKSRKGDLTVNGLKLVNIISKEFQNAQGKKIIPRWLFKEEEENIASFLRGLFSADGSVIIRNNAPIIKFTSICEEHINETRKLLYRVGISHSIFRENSINNYYDKKSKKTFSNGSQSKNIIIKNKEDFAEKIGFLLERKNKRANIKTKNLQKKMIQDYEFDLQSVKRIEEITTPNYVYDLEVKENHRFFANYVLVHNTDSIAFLLNKKSKEDAKQFLKKLNSTLPGIMELELEDFYKRGIWVTKRTGEFGAKKKYALIDYKDKLKIRGFETVRRDWCNLARETQNTILRLVLDNGNEKEALEYLKKVVKEVKERKVALSEMTVRTQLKKPIDEYKSITPHVVAARKMMERKIPIDMGTLIEYYIAETKEKKKLVREKVKLSDEKGEYNIEYYLKNQLLPAVENILQVFNIDVNTLLEGKKQTTLGEF